jgi:hypothetical protein
MSRAGMSLMDENLGSDNIKGWKGFFGFNWVLDLIFPLKFKTEMGTSPSLCRDFQRAWGKVCHLDFFNIRHFTAPFGLARKNRAERNRAGHFFLHFLNPSTKPLNQGK